MSRDIPSNRSGENPPAALEGQVPWELLYDTIPVGVCLVDPQLRIMKANSVFAQLTGRPGEHLVDCRLADIAPSFAEAANSAVSRVLATGGAFHGEKVKVRPSSDGGRETETIWRTSWIPVRLHGSIVGVHAAIEDITEHERAQAELLQAKERAQDALGALEDRTRELETVLDVLPLAVWRADRSGERVFGNKAAYEIFHWSPQSNASLRAAPLRTEVAGTRLIAGGKELSPDEMPLQRAARLGESCEHLLLEVVLPDGCRRMMDVNIVPLRDHLGELQGAVGAYSDVTEFKRIEEELRRTAREALESQHELQAVTSLMEAGVARCTADLRYQWVSPAFAKRLGRRVEDFIGRPIREIVGEAAFEILRPVFEQVMSGQLVEYEGLVDYKDIGKQWVHGNYVPSRDAANKVDGWVSVVTDITERKQLELGLIEADRHKTEFLAVLAHELRNPLAPLRNGLQICRLATQPGSSLARTVDMMDRQLTHLVRLVDDLLDLGRITRGKVELRRSALSLGDVLASSVESCRPQIEAHRHSLTVDVPGERLIVDGDFDRLTQVFSNVLSNSVKFTEPGGQISLRLKRRENAVVVEIADNGIGIPRDRLEDIFQMFSQVRTGDRVPQPGLGIGLALVRGLVEMHGGWIKAHSAGAGQGSRFEISLPLVEAGRGLARVAPERGMGGTAQRSMRILVVDDNEDAADTLAMLLRLKGHHTRTAVNGEEAIEEARVFRPELIFLDIGMQGMDGYEAARRLRADPLTRTVRLVALTGWGQEHDKRRASEAGFDMHFTKPLQPGALEDLLLIVYQADEDKARMHADSRP